MLAMILVGLIAGWLTGKLMNGKGYGMLTDIVLGLVGGAIGGWVFGVAGLHAHHFIGAVIVSTLGAAMLVFATRLIRGEL
ncbi:MAG: GlsB/YeaQ/YmgE family stress response membrane protein [Candidatus Binataceae bacterium]